MSAFEETIDATLDASGQLRLSHPPRVQPGPVQVTIRSATPTAPRRGLADVIREIDADQRSRGYFGRSSEEILAERKSQLEEDYERDCELDAARDKSLREEP